jgi:hypothetical protein
MQEIVKERKKAKNGKKVEAGKMEIERRTDKARWRISTK